MTKKKKEVPMPKLEEKKPGKEKSVIYYGWILTIVAIIGLFCLSLWVRKQSKDTTVQYVQKGVVTDYVCRIVGAEPDQNVVAVQCFTK